MKPKSCRKPTRFSRIFLAGFLLAAANSAHAQTTYFWDANGETADTGGSGIWDATSSLWRSGTDTGTLSQWPNTDPAVDYAQFAGTAGTVTLNSDSVNLNVNRIIFGTTGYEIKGPVAGTAALNLSGTSPQINAGTSIDATISANISGSTGFSKTGAGTLTLKGANTYSGTTTVSAGSITVEGSHTGGGWTVNNTAAGTPVTFAAGSTISIASGNFSTLGGAGSGARAITVNGAVTTTTGNVSLTGRNTMSINSGGSWTMQDGTLSVSVGNFGYSATLNVNSGGSFSYGGSNTIVVAQSTGSSQTGSGILNLRGTFTTTTGFSNTGAGSNTTGTSSVNFLGGTLKISNDIAALFASGGRPFNITVGTGGGIIDTNGFNTATSLGISGTGSLTKAGAGTLTLSGTNTYAGDTTVTGGTLVLAADNASNDASTVTISGTGMLQLTFAGSDKVDKLFVGTNEQPAGIYGHSSTGATNGGQGVGALDARFAEGTGTLTVGGTPFQLFMAAYPGLTGNDALPEADPDGDGLSNVAEFIMGGTAPNSGSAANRPVHAGISGHLTISVLVPSSTTFAGSPSPSATVQGVDVAVGGSLDLDTFARPVEETALNPGLPSAPSGYEWHTFRLVDPISSQPSGFLRASFNIP